MCRHSLIRSEATGAAWRVWPDLETPCLQGAIQENGTYLFELRGAANADAAVISLMDDRLPLARCARRRSMRHAGAGCLAFMPGRSRLSCACLTAILAALRSSPIRTGEKLTREDFDVMVREIPDDTFALFSPASSFRKNIARGAGTRPPAIARLSSCGRDDRRSEKRRCGHHQ